MREDLTIAKNPEKVKEVMKMLFEKQDWTKATMDEVNAFLRKLSSIQEEI